MRQTIPEITVTVSLSLFRIRERGKVREVLKAPRLTNHNVQRIAAELNDIGTESVVRLEVLEVLVELDELARHIGGHVAVQQSLLEAISVEVGVTDGCGGVDYRLSVWAVGASEWHTPRGRETKERDGKK